MRYDSSSTPAPPDPNRSADAPQPRTPRGLAIRIGGTLICTALTIVIVAPIALSSQDLVRWASDPAGLGLPEAWAWLVFIALDAAAAVCVGMVSLAAWRGESGGAFHVLTWLFALGSAFANFRHGRTTPAKDDEYFFAAMSIAGPLLLDVTLARVRRWTRVEARTQMAARPRFGLRWLPGVAFRETLRAWQASLREDIARPADAIAYVREVRALAGLTPADALRFAWQALGHTDPYIAWQWLVARGVTIDQATVLSATAALTSSATSAALPPAPSRLELPGHQDSASGSTTLPTEPGEDPQPEIVEDPLPADSPVQSQPNPAAPEPVQPGEDTTTPEEDTPPSRAPGRSRSAASTPRRSTTAAHSTTGDRLADAVQMLKANSEITAPELADQLRALGWLLSDRTATRVLSQARAEAQTTRLTVAR